MYERPALSRDKDAIMRLEREVNVIANPKDIVKQPTVLEFLGLEEKAEYSESDLETAIIDKLQKFLLELGKGYLFEARQNIDSVKHMIEQTSAVLVMALYQVVAFTCASEQTIAALNDFNKNSNYKLQNLMMISRVVDVGYLD